MLEHFFGSKTRVKLLYIFFREPRRKFYVRELVRLINIQLNAVRRELANLEKFGIIHQTLIDTEEDPELLQRSKYYVLATNHVLYNELSSFLAKAQILEQKNFLDELLSAAGDVKICLVTGFFLQRSALTDVLLVGALTVPALEKVISRFEREQGRVLHYTLMDEKEFRERQELGDVFIRQLFESPHSLLVDRLHAVT